MDTVQIITIVVSSAVSVASLVFGLTYGLGHKGKNAKETDDVNLFSKQFDVLTKICDEQSKQITELQKSVEAHGQEIRRLEEMIKEKDKRIKDLMEILANRDPQLTEFIRFSMDQSKYFREQSETMKPATEKLFRDIATILEAVTKK